MALFYEQDLAAFFQDFGEAAILADGKEITVIFDAAFTPANPMDANIEATKPTVTAKTEDVESLAHGDTMEIRRTIYMIVGIQPDGTGITTIILGE